MIEIIPAIDLMGGKCVRLEQGDFARRTVYDADPSEAAKRFRDAGIRRLHMVDLDGARSGGPRNLATLERAASLGGLSIDYGGGVRTPADVSAVLVSGASLVNIGSVAVKDPSLFAEMVARFGPERFLPGADARDGFAAVDGWTEVTRTSVQDLLLHFADLGIPNAFVTDVGSDGMMNGPAIELYNRLIAARIRVGLIASGGVRDMSDVAALEAAGCVGVIIGKAFYEGTIRLEEVAAYVGEADSAVSRR